MSVVGFGLVVPTQQAWCSVNAVERIAREAERLAFDSLWLPDHLVAPLGSLDEVGFRDSNYDWMRGGEGTSRRVTPAQYYGSTGWFLECYATLAFLAGITKRLRLGSSVIVLPYRNPIVQARMAQTIDVLSRGRLILGFGAGHIRAEAAALGVPYDDRGARVEEYLLAMKALWSDDRAEFHGERVDFGELLTLGRPAQRPHPPIYYGGMGRRAIRRAVEHFDGWLVTPTSLEPAELRRGIEYARSQEEVCDRRRGFDVVLMSVARLGLPDARARHAWSEDELGAYYALPPDQQSDELVAQLAPYLALGVGGLIVSFPAPDVETYLDQARCFSREVIPQLTLRPSSS